MNILKRRIYGVNGVRVGILIFFVFIFSGCSTFFSAPEIMTLDTASGSIAVPEMISIGDIVTVQENEIVYQPISGEEVSTIVAQKENAQITHVFASAETQQLYWVEEWEAAFFTTVYTIMNVSVETGQAEEIHWSRDAFTTIDIAPSGEYMAFVQEGDAFVLHISSGSITRLEEDVVDYAWLPSVEADAVLISAAERTQYVILDSSGDVVSRVSMAEEEFDAVSFLDDKTAIVAKGLRTETVEGAAEENSSEQLSNEVINESTNEETTQVDEEQLTPAEIVGIPEKDETPKEIPQESELYVIDLLTNTSTPVIALGADNDSPAAAELADVIDTNDDTEIETEEVEQIPLRFSYITDIVNMSTVTNQQVLLEMYEIDETSASAEPVEITEEESSDSTVEVVQPQTNTNETVFDSRIQRVVLFSITNGIRTPIAVDSSMVGSRNNTQILLTQNTESGKEMDIVVHTIGKGVQTQLISGVSAVDVISF